MGLIAKMYAWQPQPMVNDAGEKTGEIVMLMPVVAADPSDPNHVWASATPSGRLELYITNPDAWGQISPMKHYIVRIEEA